MPSKKSNCCECDCPGDKCTCPDKDCPRHGKCCDCIAYHRPRGETPQCY